MASKFGLAGGIPERRVRPIWDAIDSRQFKNALKLCSSLLSKYPNYPYALALKALTLERMGKSEEALSVCSNAKELLFNSDSVFVDELTLSTLQIVFQRLDHLDMATSCYEFACGKFPNNLEVMIGLFNCYVREYSFVKQQQIAIKMYKIGAEERFLLWAVCSIQLQVLCGSEGEKLLPLAEGLLKKHIASHSLRDPEALIVYISLLEQQSKYGDALAILSGNLGSLIKSDVDRLKIQGRLLARAGDYAAAADIFQEVLGTCLDDWECFLQYLGCLLEDDSSLCLDTNCETFDLTKNMNCNNLLIEDAVFDSRISSASSFVEKLLDKASEDLIRCPYLARLEIERRKLIFGRGNVDKLMEAAIQYFSRFGHLACFTSDVELFLDALSQDKKFELLDKLVKNCESLTTTPLKNLGLSISLFKVRELVGDMFALPLSDLEEFAVQMAAMYCRSLPLSKDLDVQESMHGEELLSMVCNILVQLFWRTRNLGYLLESIMVLEFGLTVRRYVWQYKILLLHIYSHWGAVSQSHEWYKSMDVKNILLETVSHHILPQMLVAPLWADLNGLLTDYLKFMDDHFRESADHTFLAYRHRNYSKVIEFVRFKERLQRSSQYLMAKIEAPILQLKQNAGNIEEEERVLESMKCGVHFVDLSCEIGSKSLTFNEDLKLRPWWTPTCEKNYLLGPFEGVSYCPRENLIKQREGNVIKTIEKRSLLPRMIYLSIQCASPSVKENIDANGSLSDRKISTELRTLLERYAKILGFNLQDAIELVFEVLEGQNSSAVLSPDLIDWMNFVVFLNAWNLNSSGVGSLDRGEAELNTWRLVNSLLEKYILENLRAVGPFISSTGDRFSVLVQLVTEPLAWHSLVLQSCLRSSHPLGKKKKKGPAETAISESCLEMRKSVDCLHGVLNVLTKWLSEQINKLTDGNLDFLLSLLHGEGSNEGPGRVFQVIESLLSSSGMDFGDRITQSLQSWSSADVARKIIASHGTTLSEFLKICKLKLKALQAMKW